MVVTFLMECIKKMNCYYKYYFNVYYTDQSVYIIQNINHHKMKNNLITFSILFFTFCNAQIGNIIWEENFNNLDNWMKITGNGSWGW